MSSRARAAWLTGDIARLLITDVASGEPAGSCGLSYTELAAGEASVGYALLPEWRGRGYATRAVRLLAGWAFGPAGIARLSPARCRTTPRSHRVLERVGFRREGLQRGRLPGLAGTRLDDLTFALLPADRPLTRSWSCGAAFSHHNSMIDADRLTGQVAREMMP